MFLYKLYLCKIIAIQFIMLHKQKKTEVHFIIFQTTVTTHIIFELYAYIRFAPENNTSN